MRVIMVLLLSAAASLVASAQTGNPVGALRSGQEKMQRAQNANAPSPKDILLKNEKALRDAALKGGSSAVAKWYPDDPHTGTEQSSDKQTMLQLIREGRFKYESIDVSDDLIEIISPDLAIAHGIADVKGTLDGQDFTGKYHYSRTWVKRDGTWQDEWFQATKLPS